MAEKLKASDIGAKFRVCQTIDNRYAICTTWDATLAVLNRLGKVDLLIIPPGAVWETEAEADAFLLSQQKIWAYRNPQNLLYEVNYGQPAQYQSGFWYVVARTEDETFYLHVNGWPRTNLNEIDTRWWSKAAAESFLVRQQQIWASLQGSETSTACTCDSFKLFNLGCTCGFLKRAGNG